MTRATWARVEAARRIFQFPMSGISHAVVRLDVHEAAWRIFPTSGISHAVGRLDVHLPGGRRVVSHVGFEAEAVRDRAAQRSQLLACFALNAATSDFRHARYAPCTVAGQCSRSYPRAFQPRTMLPRDRYPVYRRRDTAGEHAVPEGACLLDDRDVVHYNPYLTLRHDAHVNDEEAGVRGVDGPNDHFARRRPGSGLRLGNGGSRN